MKQETDRRHRGGGGPFRSRGGHLGSRERGKVIAFEKISTTGGAANMGMGPLGVGSRFQRHHMVSITPGEAFRKHMNFTHWRVDPRLVREIYRKSGETIDWLEDMGVEFLTVTPGVSDSRDPPALRHVGAYLARGPARRRQHRVGPQDGRDP